MIQTTECNEEGKETNPLAWKSLDRIFHAQRMDAIYSNIAGRHVLEVGCGNGSIIGELKKLKPDLFCEGLDKNPKYITNARQRYPKVRFSVGDLFKYRGKADTVIMTEVLEHVFNPVDALSQLKRIAKRRIILTVPNKNAIENPEHVLFLDRARFELLLKQVFDKGIEIRPVARDWQFIRNNRLVNAGLGRISRLLNADHVFEERKPTFANSVFLLAIIDVGRK